MTHYTQEFLNAADPFRSFTLTQTNAHTLPRTPLMMCFYRRWELNLHFTPCLFLEFLTVSLDLSSGDLRDPVLGWRGMTARLLISNCASVCACVFSLDERTEDLCHPPEWIGGSTVELWWTENKHNQSARTELRHKRLCCFSHKCSFSLFLWMFVDSLVMLQNVVHGLVAQD